MPGRAEAGPPQLLVLASPEDRLALGVARRWRDRFGTGALTLVTPDSVAMAEGLSFRLDGSGAEAAFRMPDGTSVGASGSTRPSAVLNRWDTLSPVLFSGWSETDRAYGLSEFHAFLVAFLEALGGRIANRPSAQWAAGPSLRPLHWAALAAQAGLTPADWFETSSRRAFPAGQGALALATDPVAIGWDRPESQMAAGEPTEAFLVGDRVFGPVGLPEDALLRLAGSAGLAFCCVSLLRDPWRFVAADPFPPAAPPPVLDALCAWLAL